MSNNSILTFRIKQGQGAVALDTVYAIIPDVEQPDTRSVVFTSIFPEGITADVVASKLIGEWSELLEENSDEAGSFMMELLANQIDEEE